MDLVDRLVTLAIGGFVGYVLARIVDYLRVIKTEVDTIYVIETERNEHGDSRLRSVILNSLLFLVVVLVAYAAIASNQANHAVAKEATKDKVAVCRSLAEGRNTDRRLVEAVYRLAIGSAERPEGSPPLTKQELKQFNAYITRVNKFRRDQYAKIQPSKICEPYVDDEGRKPPTPDTPLIKH